MLLISDDMDCASAEAHLLNEVNYQPISKVDADTKVSDFYSLPLLT